MCFDYNNFLKIFITSILCLVVICFFYNNTINAENDIISETNWTFNYTGDIQEWTAPYSGDYKLETWGASGGDALSSYGGYGGYSTGTISLKKGDKLYISVGQK